MTKSDDCRGEAPASQNRRGLVFLFLPIYLVGLFTFSMFVVVVVTDSRENRRQR